MKKYWIGVLLIVSMPAWATAPTPAEDAMCLARVYSRLDRSNPNSGHMQHYCYGLRSLNRSYAAQGNVRIHYLKESINEFDYVLNKTTEDYVMRGEVHVERARALNLLGKRTEAVTELNKALRYSSYFAVVYPMLGDIYQEMGNKQKALEMVTEGLRRNPDSKGLKRRYTEFGGKLPYPEAIAKVMLPEETEAKAEAATLLEGATNQAADGANPTAPTAPTPQIDPPRIGSPKNPYCRFCPD